MLFKGKDRARHTPPLFTFHLCIIYTTKCSIIFSDKVDVDNDSKGLSGNNDLIVIDNFDIMPDKDSDET